MTKAPTYTANEIKRMAMSLNDAEGLTAIANLINEEMDLYTDEDLPVLVNASMVIFVRSLIVGSIKLLPL